VKAHPELMEGVRVSQFFVPRLDDPRTASFIADFQAFTGKEPNYGHAFAYDAVYLVRDAVLHNGASRDGVKAYLDHLIHDRIQSNGVVGPYTLGEDHDARRALHVVEMRSGNQIFLKTIQAN